MENVKKVLRNNFRKNIVSNYYTQEIKNLEEPYLSYMHVAGWDGDLHNVGYNTLFTQYMDGRDHPSGYNTYGFWQYMFWYRYEVHVRNKKALDDPRFSNSVYVANTKWRKAEYSYPNINYLVTEKYAPQYWIIGKDITD